MELELVVLVFASFRAYRMLTILAFESKSSSLCEQIQDHGTGRLLPARSRLRSRKGILIVWHACSFLASSILFKLLNVFHSDSVLLRNLSQCFAFCQTCVLTIRTRASRRGSRCGFSSLR